MLFAVPLALTCCCPRIPLDGTVPGPADTKQALSCREDSLPSSSANRDDQPVLLLGFRVGKGHSEEEKEQQ